MSEQLIRIFVDEASELVRRASTAAMTLETAPPGQREEPHAAILRELHTLKGAAGSVNLPVGDHIAKAVHHMEDRLMTVGGPSEALTIIGSVIDGLEEMGVLVQRLADGDSFDASEFAAPPESDEPAASEGLGTADPDAEGLFLFDDEEEEAPKAAPPPPKPKAKAKAKTRDAGQSKELLRVRPERIDAAHELASELMVSHLQTAAQTQEIIEIRDGLLRANMNFRALNTALREERRSLGPLWIKLEPLLARLQSELSELRQGAGGLGRRSTSLRDRSGALVGSVEASIRTLRVMPIQPFLEELLPVVREATRLSGRRARLVLDGEGAEADRHVLVGLRDPLLHLVRNSVAHGIGDPDRREADGRDPVGTISIEARCQGPRLKICVRDDGYGVDTAKVIKRGAELGLVAPDASMDDSGILFLICQPSFSTTREADALSGRGVGMNVVLDAVERLGGRMDLETNPGTGACFKIDVPIAAATTKGLVVVCGGGQFGLPLAQVERVVRIRAEDLIGEEHPFVQIEGEPVAVAPLGGFVDQPVTPLGSQRRPAVVLHAHGARLALLVDDVPGESELVVKPMPAAFAQHPLVSGGAVQADSSVLLVLDLPALVQQVQREGLPCGVLREAPPRAPEAPTTASLELQ